MASTSKCPYCGSSISSNEEQCPNCGAANLNYVEPRSTVVMTPKTIEELKQYCAERGMPLYKMRFFIGEDFKEPRAFGIYKKGNGDVCVYKNKDTGERAIRYEGPDEAHGVEEIYLKLLDECHKRNIWPDTPDGKAPKNYKEEDKKASGFILEVFVGFFSCVIGLALGNIVPIVSVLISAVIIFFLVRLIRSYIVNKGFKSDKTAKIASRIAILFMAACLLGTYYRSYQGFRHPEGYYITDNGIYYHIGTNWYLYSDDSNDWAPALDYSSVYDDGPADYAGESWSSDWGSTAYDFKKSTAYSEYQEARSSDNSDYDSWDSNDTDWGSDW
ncbi:MAG: hypothetical protein K5770_18115 [Lachnospiraceae bacterium]|nr:hypothetical protein [Lachnospiraceae bacterium]